MSNFCSIRFTGKIFAVLATMLLVVSCASTVKRVAVPDKLINKASVANMTQIRFWGDQSPPNLNELAKVKYLQTKAARPNIVRKGARPVINFLALSGGGSDGAFGAGLLTGWSEKGSRPEFELVSGPYCL